MVAKHRVFTWGLAMLGFPTETVDEMKQTIDVICKSRLHAALFFVVTPFPNTQLFAEVVEKSPEKLQNMNYETGDYLYNITTNLSNASNEEFLAMKRMANQKFFLNPNRLARILRDYPSRWQLVYFVNTFIRNVTKRSMR
jgi:radical SAM superfamily enzyme YgiQ (UPF0313 family)